MGNAYKYFLVVVCLAVLLLPAMQRVFQIIPLQQYALVKVPENAGVPEPVFKNFLENTYQDSVISWFNATTGFRPLLLRLRNQIDYSCFNIARGRTMSGKDGYLYLDESVQRYTGETYDSAFICRRMDSVEMLRKYLAQRNIPLLFVVEPGKAAFYKQHLPDEAVAMKKSLTAYELLLGQLQAKQIDYIDLASYYIKIREHSPYELFPKLGMHWTNYGAAVGLDTVYKKIARVLNFEPLKIDLSKVTLSTELKFPEDDLAEMMNILKIKHLDTLATPVPVCSPPDSQAVRKPKILFIGDSYTYMFGFTNLPLQLFDPGSRYWFYMKSEKDFADIMKEGTDLSKKDLLSALKQFDMVLILSTDARYDYGDYGLYGRLITEKATQ